MNLDLLVLVGLPFICSVQIVVYIVYASIFGKPRFERVDQQGGNRLLGKTVMEVFYLNLQPLARLMAHWRISPNAISLVSLLLGLMGGLMIAGEYVALAIIALILSGLLDVVDGAVARMKGQVTEVGYVLDSQLDRYVEFFFLAGAVVYYRMDLMGQLAALSCLLGSFLVSYSTLMARLKNIDSPPGSIIMRRSERLCYLVISTYLLLFARRVKFQVDPFYWGLMFVASLSNFSAIQILIRILKTLRVREFRAR